MILLAFALACTSTTEAAAAAASRKKIRGSHIDRQPRTLQEINEPSMAPTTKKSANKVVCVYDTNGDLVEEQDLKMSRTTLSDKKQKKCKKSKSKDKDGQEQDVVFVADNVYEDEDGNLV